MRKVRVEVTIPTMGYKRIMTIPMSTSSVSKRIVLKNKNLISLIFRGPTTTSGGPTGGPCGGPCGNKLSKIKKNKIYGK